MLINKPKREEKVVQLCELQKMALSYLPEEQVTKFSDFTDYIEKELLNEAREPEMSNVIKDLFNALHEKNTAKLLKVLQGDKQRIFYAFKKQLEGKKDLTKNEAIVLKAISEQELSLVSISLMK